MSDKSIELELETAPKEMSPQALSGWYKGQMQSLEPRLRQYRTLISSKDKEDYLSGEPKDTHAAPKTATLADIALTAQKSGKSTAEVTKALKDKGYIIKEQ